MKNTKQAVTLDTVERGRERARYSLLKNKKIKQYLKDGNITMKKYVVILLSFSRYKNVIKILNYIKNKGGKF